MMKTVIFDFDGTIADTLVLVKGILNKLGPKYGYGLFDDGDISELEKMSVREIVEKYHISKYHTLRIVWDSQREVAKSLKQVKAFPKIESTLRGLQASGHKVAIVSTNSKKNIEDFLNRENIKGIDYVYSTINPFGKAALIKRFLRKRHIKQSAAVYVGDESRDIDTATEAGIDCISVSWGYNTREVLEKTATKIVDSPRELLTAINELDR